MISATEALRLPNAQLTETQQEKLVQLDAHVEEAVRKGMNFRGVGGIKIGEMDMTVIAALDYRLKKAGWKPEWKAVLSDLNKSAISHFILNLDAEEHARDALAS